MATSSLNSKEMELQQMQLDERELHQKCLALFEKLKKHLEFLHSEMQEQESLITEGASIEACLVTEGATLEACLVNEGIAVNDNTGNDADDNIGPSYESDTLTENNSNIIYDIPNMDPDRDKEEHDDVDYEQQLAFFASLINNPKCDVEKYNEVNREAQQANALLTNEFKRYKEKEKDFAKDMTIESKYCKKIKLLNDEISYLKSQACEKDKTFAKENGKFDEYVQPLLNRKNELEKKNQEFLKQINHLDNRLQKAGQTDQTLRMLLPKEDNVNTGKQRLGFENQNDYVNPSLLNQAKELAPCLYNIDEIGKDKLSDHKIISEEELKCEAEKRLKVKQRKSPLSYHGFVYVETQFEEPPKVPLKRRNVNLKEHLEQVQLRNYDPKLWNSLPMKYFCYVKQAMLKFEKQTFPKIELNQGDLFRMSFEQSISERVRNRLSKEFEHLVKNVNLQLNCFEKSLVKEMKDDLKYVMSLEYEFDEACLILDIYQDYQEKDCQGRLLDNFQDDIKYEHVGPKTQDRKKEKYYKDDQVMMKDLKGKISSEPTVSPLDDNQIDFRISFDEFDNEDYTVIYDKSSFSYKIISVNDLKTDLEDGNNEVNIPSNDVVVEQLDNGVHNVDTQSHEFDEDLETNHDIHRKSFNMGDYLMIEVMIQKRFYEGMPLIFIIKDFYVPFSIPFDPKRFYKDGVCTRKLRRPRIAEGIFDLDVAGTLQFQLGGTRCRMSWEVADKGDLSTYLTGISFNGDCLGIVPSYTSIKDPLIRLCHRLIAFSIDRRSQAPKKVTSTDLFYLRSIDVGSLNIHYLLAQYLRRYASGRKQGA
ncbi:hypothetical protein Tco_0345053 [Tanacetum coccineum]